jgi:hypothetical protein
MSKRRCYQCGDEDLDEIRERRNAEIRAWGKQVLADSDAALLAEHRLGESEVAVSDWDLLETEDGMDATAATEPQETEEVAKKVAESPKPEPQADPENLPETDQNEPVAVEEPKEEEAEVETKKAAPKKSAAKGSSKDEVDTK